MTLTFNQCLQNKRLQTRIWTYRQPKNRFKNESGVEIKVPQLRVHTEEQAIAYVILEGE